MSADLQLTIERPPPLTLRNAVLLYEGNGKSVATIHNVSVSQSGKPTILAGKTLTQARSRHLLAGLGKQTQAGSFLPESVLMTNGDLLMWYEGARVRHLGFKASDQFPGRSLGTRGGRVPTPGVIFLVGERTWIVIAYKGSAGPTPATALFRAPTYNTDADGMICVGSVKVPECTTVDRIAAWSDAFWRSYFTHANYEGVVNYKGDASRLWQDALDGKFGPAFPEKVLKPYHLTLGEYLDKWRTR